MLEGGSGNLTITETDRDNFLAQIETFLPQITEDMCLSTCCKNILDELETRHDVTELGQFSISDLNDMADYERYRGSSSRFLPRRLGPELEDIGYTVHMNTGLDRGDLIDIILDDRASKPVVELDPLYYDSVDLYDVESGTFGERLPHTVIVEKVNSDSVLFYDPLKDYYWDGDEPCPPSERPTRLFEEWWGGRAEPFWTLWIEPSDEQTTLDMERFDR